jgi:hypothetical protein
MHTDHLSTRRHFLASGAFGVGSIALAWLLDQDGLRAAPARPELEPKVYDLTPKPPHYPPRARAMISLWMQGGPSHIDLFDPKPEMAKWDGKKYPGEVNYDMANQASDKVLAPLWKFHKHGQCGMELSELLPHLGEVVDDITLIRSMYTDVNNHGSSIRALQTGNMRGGRAALGSWIPYALGSESQNLPAFVALTDTGPIPVQGVENWSNGFLPPIYQGTVIRPEQPRIINLEPFPHLRGEVQDSALGFLERMNRRHLEQRPGNHDLQARISSYELAARMQIAATEVLDFSDESEATRRMYGLDDPATRQFGANCLLARRLIERGVRFVQIYTRSQYWDHHNTIISQLPACCQRTDKPSAALVKDLKQRGLLDSTIVHWGGEMGRLPVVQTGGNGSRQRIGRDHNTHGFSMWLAGGGFKPGQVYGATDEFGHRAVVDRVSHHNYHATLLHLLGLDHTRLTFRAAGREQSLTDGQPARIIGEVLEHPPAASEATGS